MRISIALFVLLLVGCIETPIGLPGVEPPFSSQGVGISKDKFYINGRITYPGTQAEGLLLNVRAVNSTFDDLENGQSGYLDSQFGLWNPDDNTDRFIAALPYWRESGILAVTLNFQGGCLCSIDGLYGYKLAGDYQSPNNNPFGPAGINTAYLDRMSRVLESLEQNGMVAILGLFYFGQDQRISRDQDSELIRQSVDWVVDWILQNDWRHVLLEINNEATMSHWYQHDVLKPHRVHELFIRVKERSVRPDGTRIYVSSSSTGMGLPPESWMREADFFLPHGNGLNASQIKSLVSRYRSHPFWVAVPRPIIFNEDSTDIKNYEAAVSVGASWGFYNDEFVQCVPSFWSLDDRDSQLFLSFTQGLIK